ncbi:hypothetical protein GQ55_9G424800 [Panicum hallii var. hallii]|uniref:Uncharacterized protein n=1 Tax=Panicum hallii var. hallii TaxID=1504633 RepID=A0A2T7CAT7_9POAL|nr:hypothetical protein GQ55_9G424800 [Panicum hallii var. hallii]
MRSTHHSTNSTEQCLVDLSLRRTWDARRCTAYHSLGGTEQRHRSMPRQQGPRVPTDH